MSTRRAALKIATEARHRALDARVATLNLAHADEYRAFLEASAAALLPLEALLTASGAADHIADWPQRLRSPALRADLAALHGEVAPLALEQEAFAPSQ